MTETKYDCMVVGAGVSGVCAAVCAARSGLHTLLIEQREAPGGSVSAAFHRHICGIYANDPKKPFKLLNKGITSEIVKMLNSKRPGDNETRMGKMEVYSFDCDHFVEVLTALIAAEDSLDVMFSARLEDLTVEGDTITGVEVSYNGKSERIIPGAVIDCSGGIAIEKAGDQLPATTNSERPLSGYSIRMNNIAESIEDLHVKIPYFIRKAADSGRLASELRFSTYSPGPAPTEGTLRLNIPHAERDDINTLVKAYAIQIRTFLANEIDEFATSTIYDQSPFLIDRDGTAIDGEYILTENDVLSAKKFKEGVVKSAWAVEFWNSKTGPGYSYLDEGEYYEIPAGCLRSKNITNLYAAGRCISAEPRALASCRVAGTCMALGEAAAGMVAKAMNGDRR